MRSGFLLHENYKMYIDQIVRRDCFTLFVRISPKCFTSVIDRRHLSPLSVNFRKSEKKGLPFKKQSKLYLEPIKIIFSKLHLTYVHLILEKINEFRSPHNSKVKATNSNIKSPIILR